MLARILVVFRKELVDNLRDRRTLFGATASILLGPAMLLLLFTVMGRANSERAERPLPLPVVGAEYAPNLISFLKQNNVDLLPGPSDPEAEVRTDRQAVVLVIPESYGSDFRAGSPATVRLVADESRQRSASSVSRARRLLQAYSQQTAAARLMSRGVSPQVVSALAIENVDVSTPQSMAAGLLNMIPFFLIFSVFIGGMYLAIDTTAGERERGSLEPLLINPVARRDLVLGKLSAILLFTLLAVIGTLVAFSLILGLLPLEEYFGVQFSLSPASLVAVFLIVAPMTLLAAALQMIVATYTRSYKEASSYLGFLPMVPGIPGLVLTFLPVKAELWPMLIPTFGQQLLIIQVIRGEQVDPVNVAVSVLVTLGAGLGLVLFAIRLYEGERLLFAR